jgi:hypothetical protein
MMADHSIGKIFVELDLDPSKYMKGLQGIHKDASVVTLDVEKNFKDLGIKSSQHFDLLRAKAENAYQGIKHSSLSSANDIVRAEEAKNAKLTQLNEQQFGKQRSIIDTLKTHWIAASAAVIASVALIGKAYGALKSAAALTNDIERQARVLGMSTDALQKLQYTAKMADVEAVSLAQGVKLLSRNMEDAAKGSGEASKYFQAMGVSVKDAQGNLRPLDAVMGDVADKFASWEDGPRKIAIALALFGRAGEQMIPLLNQGSSGMRQFGEEADKLGVILSPGLIKKGSQLESNFKKLEASITAIKTSFTLALAPTWSWGDAIAKLGKQITEFWQRPEVKKLIEYGKNLLAPLSPLNQMEMYLTRGSSTAEEESEIRRKSGWTAKGVTTAMPPDVKAMEEAEKKRLEEQKRILDLRKKLVSEIEDLENKMKGMGASPWGDSEPLGLKKGEMALYHWTTDLEEIYGYSKETVEEFKALGIEVQNIYTINRATITTIDQEVASANALAEAYKKIAIQADEFISSNEQMLAIEERTVGRETKVREEAEKELKTRVQKEADAAIETKKMWVNAAFDIGDAFTDNFTNVAINGFKNMKEAAINFALEIASIMKRLAMQALFTNIMKGITSAATAGAGGGGMPIPSFGSGTVVNSPMLARVGEVPEAIIPLKNGAVPVKGMGGGGGNTYVFISAPDAEGVTRLFQRNSGTQIQIIQDHLDNRGPLVDTIRSVM